MSGSASIRSRSSITKFQDILWDINSYVDPIATASIKSAKSTGVRRVTAIVAKHVAILLTVIATIALLGSVGGVPLRQNQGYSSEYNSAFSHCNADGSFTPTPAPTFSLWDPSGLFQITLTWGHMSFSQAKFIDVVWDIVVGRGGQAVMLYIAFKVFTKTLQRTMESEPVSYRTFEAMAFTSPTFVSPWILIRDFLTNRGWRARAAIVWTILASVFVLAFPTLNDTMSGYNTNRSAFLKDTSGVLVPWTSYKVVQLIVQDGERVGLSSPTFVTDDPTSEDSCRFYGPQLFTYLRDAHGTIEPVPLADPTQGWSSVWQNCMLFWHVIEYGDKYGWDGRNNTPSIFNNSGSLISLSPPTLNITSLFAHSSLDILTAYFTGFPDNDTDILDDVTDDFTQSEWVWQGDLYDAAYVHANGTCEPLNTHNWGFSFLFLFIVCLLTAIWAIGMYIMWLDAYLNSRFDRAGRDMGVYRAAHDFAAAMRKDMGDGPVAELAGNAAIRTQVRCAMNGDRVAYHMDDHAIPPSRRDELRIWWGAQSPRFRSRPGIRAETAPHARQSFLDADEKATPRSAPPYPHSTSFPAYLPRRDDVIR